MKTKSPYLLPPGPLAPEWVEHEYNNRSRFPDYARLFERWEEDSENVRRTRQGRLDLSYGPDRRHRVDLFPARASERLLVFFHGGYWRSLDKRMFAWIVPDWLERGVSVALFNYRLCPAARITDAVEDAVAALRWTMVNAAVHGAETRRVVLAGHSAGAHLAAAVLATPRTRFKFAPSRLAGAALVSGVYDFSPLPHFSGNADLRLDASSARDQDLYDREPAFDVPLVLSVGAEETGEFIRQSRLLADCWAPQVRELQVLPGLHHFTVVGGLARAGHPLHEATLALFD